MAVERYRLGAETNQTLDSTYTNRRAAQKQLVEELKVEWKTMWSERYNDKIVAEGVSVSEYRHLHVNRGTIIHATRNFKPLNFKDILTEHLVENPERYIEPNAAQGGWSKFIKTQITAKTTPNRKRAQAYVPIQPHGAQPKKGGRGWLHAK